MAYFTMPSTEGGDSFTSGGAPGLKEFERELARTLDGIAALSRLSLTDDAAQATEIARAFSEIDEALADAVRQLYENVEDFDGA